MKINLHFKVIKFSSNLRKSEIRLFIQNQGSELNCDVQIVRYIFFSTIFLPEIIDSYEYPILDLVNT